jgi:hypothetical protein
MAALTCSRLLASTAVGEFHQPERRISARKPAQAASGNLDA